MKLVWWCSLFVLLPPLVFQVQELSLVIQMRDVLTLRVATALGVSGD